MQNGDTPLSLAMKNGDTDKHIVEMLLAKKKEVSGCCLGSGLLSAASFSLIPPFNEFTTLN